MDNEELRVLDDGSLLAASNSTEIIIRVPEDVEPLSIIVWCVGGVLLVTLLALLGRIILAKRKHPFENLDENGEPSTRRRNNVFRIRIDGPEFNGYHNRPEPSYLDPALQYQSPPQRTEEQSTENQPIIQTQSQTPGSGVYHVRMGHQRTLTGSDTDVVPTSGSATQNGGDVTQCSASSRQAQESARNYNSAINRTSLVVPEYSTHSDGHLEALQGGRLVTCSGLSGGRLASLNGYLISPPPYQQVVGSNAPLASVVVARQQRSSPRRIDFSL